MKITFDKTRQIFHLQTQNAVSYTHLGIAEIGGDPFAGHAPREAGVGAERLHIDEIAPAPDGLSDEKTHTGDVEDRKQLHFAELDDEGPHQNRADESTVNCHAAFPSLDDRAQIVLEGIPTESNVVKPRADDTADDAAQHHVNELVGDLSLIHISIRFG